MFSYDVVVDSVKWTRFCHLLPRANERNWFFEMQTFKCDDCFLRGHSERPHFMIRTTPTKNIWFQKICCDHFLTVILFFSKLKAAVRRGYIKILLLKNIPHLRERSHKLNPNYYIVFSRIFEDNGTVLTEWWKYPRCSKVTSNNISLTYQPSKREADGNRVAKIIRRWSVRKGDRTAS